MNSGRLRQRIIIERQQHGEPDPHTGHSTVAWVNLLDDDGKFPAEVLEGPGREPFSAGTIQAETTARINFRYFEISKAELMKCRIRWDGNIFDIVSAERDATGRREWRLRCTDGVNDG